MDRSQLHRTGRAIGVGLGGAMAVASIDVLAPGLFRSTVETIRWAIGIAILLAVIAYFSDRSPVGEP